MGSLIVPGGLVIQLFDLVFTLTVEWLWNLFTSEFTRVLMTRCQHFSGLKRSNNSKRVWTVGSSVMYFKQDKLHYSTLRLRTSTAILKPLFILCGFSFGYWRTLFFQAKHRPHYVTRKKAILTEDLRNTKPFPETATEPKKPSHFLLSKFWEKLRSSLSADLFFHHYVQCIKKGLFVPLSLTWTLYSCSSDAWKWDRYV